MGTVREQRYWISFSIILLYTLFMGKMLPLHPVLVAFFISFIETELKAQSNFISRILIQLAILRYSFFKKEMKQIISLLNILSQIAHWVAVDDCLIWFLRCRAALLQWVGSVAWWSGHTLVYYPLAPCYWQAALCCFLDNRWGTSGFDFCLKNDPSSSDRLRFHCARWYLHLVRDSCNSRNWRQMWETLIKSLLQEPCTVQ